MNRVYAEIELINGNDLAMVRRNIIDLKEVRHMCVNAIVDNRVLMLCINEVIQEQLQLPVIEKREAQFPNGHIVECDVVAPVEIRFKNRQTSSRAMVLPNNLEPLLGAIPMTDMDVIICPDNQELIVNPNDPDLALMKV